MTQTDTARPESLSSNAWLHVFQCEKKLKVLAGDCHGLLDRRAACQEKQHAQTVKSVVSGAHTTELHLKDFDICHF
jgi:hypothetical protein